MNRHVAIQVPQTSFGARFTTAEFLRMVETGAFDDMTLELIGGELDRLNPPMNTHAGGQAWVMLKLGSVVSHDRIRGEVGIDCGDDTVFVCDAAVLHTPVTDHRLLAPDDLLLVVEIAETTLSRDTGPKRLAYAGAGIPHYWVIDGQRRVIHVYAEPIEGDYADIRTVRFGAPLAVPGTDADITLD